MLCLSDTDSLVQEAKRQEQGGAAVPAPYTAVQHMEYVPAEYFRGEARSAHSSRVGFHLARIKPSSKDAVLRLSHLCQAHNLVRSLVLQRRPPLY